MDREQLIKLQVIGQEVEQLNSHVQTIEQNISEMTELKESIEEIGKKENQEILINIGKKIFIPVKVMNNNLIVDIGNKNLIKKSAPETRKIIEYQIEKLNETKDQILTRLKDLESEMDFLVKEYSKEHKEHKCNDEDCKHH